MRIIYKLCLFIHYIHIGLAPKYLSDCVSTVSAVSGRYRLRSTGSEAYILPRTRTRVGWTWLLLRSSRLEHSFIQPSWYYWYQYISKSTQQCTFWSCFYLILLALLDVSNSGALQILRWLIDRSIDWLMIYYCLCKVWTTCLDTCRKTLVAAVM